ncbi:aldehyde dehydrogenase family protein [Dyadobacter jejuensis]|uniref:aldehyde dehydrogenase family protein n=1 Tax=Dyadobacter jejuensis TaxID=1082580 RepID=UPI001B867B41|nr:aldehyde dehydrogenase family protein [Dyadobacter jejuensis]
MKKEIQIISKLIGTQMGMDQGIKDYYCYIDGAWITSGTGGTIEVEDPASNEVFARVTALTETEIVEALESSERAQRSWQLTPAATRAGYLFAIAEKLKLKKDHFAQLLVREQGKTLAEAYGEVDDTIRYITYSAEAGRRIQGAIFPSEKANEQLTIHKVPYGVTVGLCAFNYPLALIGRKVGPALVTGNTMIIKPHELTPVTAAEFCKLVEEVGLPKGVINMVATKSAAAAALLVESPITKLVSLTGSTRAGRAMYHAAAENITALTLELGGKAPFIVCEDAQIDKAVEAAVVSRFANCGQVCICNEMIMVHEKIVDEFTDKLIRRVREIKVGNPMASHIDMGPSVSRQGLERIHRLVQENIGQGAELVLGGNRPEGAYFERGNWYEPTVLTRVRPDQTTVQEELFGPVLPVMTVSGFEEAVSISNARAEGLSAYLFTNDYKRHLRAIDTLQVGTIFINRGIVGYIQGYHSGHKTSGIGGEDGVFGIEGFLQKKTVYLDYED